MRAFVFLTALVLITVGLGIAVIAGFGAAASYQPVFADAPLVPPATHVLTFPASSGGTPTTSCGLTSPGTTNQTPTSYVTVSPSPSAVTAVWLPGLNTMPCAAVITYGGQTAAQVLAADVNREPEVAVGLVYMCPNADGTQVNLYFSYGSGAPSELVNVSLSGCRWILAPGRNARWWTGPGTAPSFGPTLAKIAPSAWLSYLEER